MLTLEADQPGLQFYSGKFLDGSNKGKGATYKQYDGFCLETQKYPNAINVPAWKDQVILKPGQTYKHVMVHRFSVGISWPRMSEAKTHTGGCHCGKVRFEVTLDLSEPAITCNCSMCGRSGTMLRFVPASAVQATVGRRRA